MSAFSATSLQEQHRYAETIQNVESQIRKKSIFVPTDDNEVKLRLRACGEPICLFGEGKAERRERLRDVLDRKTVSEEDVTSQKKILGLSEEKDEYQESAKETVYERAPQDLIEARKYISVFSIEKCRERLDIQKRESEDMNMFATYEKRIKALWDQYREVNVDSSQFGSDRPISCCRLNNVNEGSISSSLLLTGCFGGEIRLWDVTTSDQIHSWKAHEERVCSVAWNPCSELHSVDHHLLCESNCPAFVSASLDKTAKIWSYNNATPTCLHTLSGHLSRVTAAAFHPSGRFVGTTSCDGSFRFWDVETGKQLLLQDGHAREVFGLSFQCDGSIVATCDQSGVARIWDLRTGRCISTLQGHIKGMLSCCFSPNGFQFATSSDDNTAKIWDLRKQKSIYTIPAHKSVIPDLRYDSTGEFLITCSFDSTVKVWSTRNFTCLRTLEGHDGRVSGVDVMYNQVGIVSCSHDKTWKKWIYGAL